MALSIIAVAALAGAAGTVIASAYSLHRKSSIDPRTYAAATRWMASANS